MTNCEFSELAAPSDLDSVDMFGKLQKYPKLVATGLKICVKWEIRDHETVRLVFFCAVSHWHIRILLIRVTLQPIIKYNHTIMCNE